MYIRFGLVSVCLALGAFSTPIKRDVSTIVADITNIDSQTISLDNVITGIQNGGLGATVGAAEAVLDVSGLEGAIQTATNDINGTPGPLSDADGNMILGRVKKELVPSIQQTLTDITSAKSTISGLVVPGATNIVLSDIKSLRDSSAEFIVALESIFPADLLSNAQAQAALVNKAFSDAIAAYSS